LSILNDLIASAQKKKQQLEQNISQAIHPATSPHPVQTINPALAAKIATSQHFANNPAAAQNFIRQGAQVAPPHINIASEAIHSAPKALEGFGLGMGRSAIGTGQAVSGLVDLASKGTGTNRVSKLLDRGAKNLDTFAAQQGVTPAYKVGQLTGDTAQFFSPGVALKGAAVANDAGKAAKLVNGLAKYDKAVGGMKFSNDLIGRTAGTITKNTLGSSGLINTAVGTLQDMGQGSSKGEKMTPQRIATDIAMNAGMNIAPALGVQAGHEVVNGAKAGVKVHVSGKGKLANNDAVAQEIANRNAAIQSLKQRQAQTPIGSVASENHQRQIDMHQAVVDQLQATKQKLTIPERLLNQQVGNTVGGPNALRYQLAKKQGRVFDGVDGKPRFEIDDSGAQLTDIGKNGFQRARVSQVLDHPELLKNYPDIANTSVTFKHGLEGTHTAGQFDDTINEIALHPNMMGNAEKTRSVLLHELQHRVQKEEGFARGGTGKSSTDGQYHNQAGEAEARAVQARADMPMSQRYVKSEPSYKSLDAEGIHKQPNMSSKQLESLSPEAIDGLKQQGYKGVSNGKRTVRFDENKPTFTHETNANWDKFDPNKIGTGQGDHWLGRGMYLQKDGTPKFEQYGKIKKQFTLADDAKVFQGDIAKYAKDKGVAGWNVADRESKGLTRHLPRDVFKGNPELIKQLQKDGYHGYHDQGGELVMYDPSKLVDAPKSQPATSLRSTFYDSLDVPKDELIIKHDGGTAMSVEKPKQYKTIHSTGETKTVDGEPIDLIKGVDTFTHKDENGNWVVSEATTGRSLTSGGYPTQKHAIEEAKANINQVGEAKFKQIIADNPINSKKAPTEIKPVTDAEVNKASIDTHKTRIEKYGNNTDEVSKKMVAASKAKIAKLETPEPTALVKSTKPAPVQPKPSGKRQLPASRETGGVSSAKSTPIKVKGSMSAEDYRARFGKDKPTETVKVAPFTKPQIDFKKWNDKNALGLGRETMERNLDRVAGKDAPAMKHLLVDSSRQNETARVQFANHLRQDTRQTIVKGLGIKAGSKESELVQKYGEGIATKEDIIKEVGQAKADRIIQASDHFRKQYDQLIDQWNVTRKKYGFDPIPKRKDYFRHFQAIDQNASILGTIKNARDLPTEISGITDIFNPNKPFSDAALQRKGNKTTYDAVGGFDNYINSVSRQIFHTDTVQKGRAVEKAIRKQAAANPTLELPNFVANLHEWTNLVSGKKTRIDRAAEELVGRKVYAAANAIRSKTGANMIGANLGSAVTNFIPFTQAAATTSKGAMLKAVTDTLGSPFTKSYHAVDGQVSSFLTRRFPDEAISFTKLQNASHAASLPFKAVDTFTSRTIVAGKYFEGRAKGLNPKEAMKAADDYASRVITDRSVGQMPNLMETKTAGFLAQFQAEVNNQVSFLARDIPQFANGNKAKIASSLIQFALYSYLANEASQHVLGRRVQLDPIHATKVITDPKSNNRQRLDALKNDIAGGLPFTSLFTGGRLPVNAMMPDVPSIAKGIGDLKSDKNKGEREIYNGVSGPLFYGVPPFGGGQIKKTLEYAQNMKKGYSETPAGTKRFDIAKDPMNTTKGLLFGQYSTTPGKEYVNNIKGGSNSSTASKGNTPVDQLKATEKQQNKDLKASLSAEDYKLSQLGKTDRQKLVSEGKYSQSKFDGLDNYVNNKKKQLGMTVAADKTNNGISTPSQKVLDEYNKLDQKTRDNKAYGENDYDYKVAQAKYENDKANGKLSRAQDINRQNDVKKAKVGTAFPKDIREAYSSLSKQEVYDLITTNNDGKKIAADLLAYGDALKSAGIEKNKFRTAKGIEDFGDGTNSATKSSSSKTSLATLLAGFKTPYSDMVKSSTKGAALARSAHLAKKTT
jgi:hypothetical protein